MSGIADQQLPREKKARPFWGWLLCFALAFLLYASTANRGAQWQDPGRHILRAVTGELHNDQGLALTHPLHHWSARLALLPGWGEPAFAITLVSAFFGALTIANLFGAVLSITQRRAAAFLAAASLSVANTFWQMATRAECYTVSSALLAAEWWCVAIFAKTGRCRYLTMALLFNGLGFANHNLALLTLPILLVLLIRHAVTRQARIVDLFVAGGLWIVGSLPFTGFVLLECLRSGAFLETVSSALFGNSFADKVLGASISFKLVGLSIGYIGFNFPNLFLLAVLIGLFKAGEVAPRRLYWPMLLGLLIHFLFVVRYDVPDQYMFFVPLYILISLFGGVGFARMLGSFRFTPQLAIALILFTPVFYAVAASQARRHQMLSSVVRHKPYRDDYTYVLIPWSIAEDSADRLSRDAVALAGPNGLIIVEDLMASYAVRYRALLSDEPRPVVVSPRDIADNDSLMTKHPEVVLVPVRPGNPTTVSTIGPWHQNGQLYQLNRGFLNSVTD